MSASFERTLSPRWRHAGLLCALAPQYGEGKHSGLCGYVFVPTGHPILLVTTDVLEVHGGEDSIVAFEPPGGGGRWWGWDDAHLEPCPWGPRLETEFLADQIAKFGSRHWRIRLRLSLFFTRLGRWLQPPPSQPLRSQPPTERKEKTT